MEYSCETVCLPATNLRWFGFIITNSKMYQRSAYKSADQEMPPQIQTIRSQTRRLRNSKNLRFKKLYQTPEVVPLVVAGLSVFVFLIIFKVYLLPNWCYLVWALSNARRFYSFAFVILIIFNPKFFCTRCYFEIRLFEDTVWNKGYA